MRTNYGQRWIEELRGWDSRNGSIGHYCSAHLQLKWRVDPAESWQDFIPDEQVININVAMPSNSTFRQCLTQSDWQELATLLQSTYSPSTSALLLAQAHQLMDESRLKYALVAAVTAIDVAISECMRAKLNTSPALSEAAKSFYNLPLPARMVAVASLIQPFAPVNLVDALKAIKMRNKVAHEGWNPTEQDASDVRAKLMALFTVTASLLDGPAFRFPSARIGNRVASAEAWEEE